MTVVRSPRYTPRARRTSLAFAASGLALLLAACGSQLDPNEVAVAGGGTVGSGGVVVGADGEVISADGGTTGSVDGSVYLLEPALARSQLLGLALDRPCSPFLGLDRSNSL